MNTDVPKGPATSGADQSTKDILAGAPPPPALNPQPAPAAPVTAPSTAIKTTTAIANKPVLFGGKIYAKGDTITAPRAALKKYASALTIAKPTNSTSRKPASQTAAPPPAATAA